jgi:TPR repeat protein
MQLSAALLLAGTALAHEEDGDLRQNVKLLRPHAEKGNMIAQFNLGVIYATGQGTHKNEREAAKWFKLSSAQGFAQAQQRLGAAHAVGAGVPRNATLALMWYQVAAAQGNEEAAKARDALARGLTAAQIADAEKRAARCEQSKFRECG